MDSFSSIYGELTNRENPKDEAENSLSDIDVKDINVNEGTENFNITPAFVSVLKYWLARSRNHRLIRSYIGGLLEELTKNSCDFCGENWGLRAEFLENLEDLYSNFRLTEKGLGNTRNDIVKWQNYFRANATVRTVCYNCSNEIWERYNHNLESLRFIQRKPAENPSNIFIDDKLNKQSQENKDLGRKTTIGSRKSSHFLGFKRLERDKESQNEEMSEASNHKRSEKPKNQTLRMLLFIWLERVRELRKDMNKNFKVDSGDTNSSLDSTEHNSNKVDNNV